MPHLSMSLPCVYLESEGTSCTRRTSPVLLLSPFTVKVCSMYWSSRKVVIGKTCQFACRSLEQMHWSLSSLCKVLYDHKMILS